MKKYITIFSSYLKQAMAYRSDALLSAVMSIFQVFISYLLWSMLIPPSGSLNGFTLREMVTYSVIVTAISPFAVSGEPMLAYASDIRTGKFSKYLYTPINPFWVFVCQSLASELPKCLMTLICGFIWGAVFNSVMEPLQAAMLLRALPMLIMAVIFILLMNYLISCLAFKFTGILGLVLIRGTLITFFTGALAPLEVLFGSAPVWSPLYYLVGYPALLIMGRETISAGTATLVLGAYILPLILLCLTVARGSRRLYEGVGA